MNKSKYKNKQVENSIALDEIDKQKHKINKRESEEKKLIKELEIKHQREIQEALKNLPDNSNSTNNRSKQRIINNFIYKKNLSSIFMGFTRKQNISFNRAITTRFNTICYSGRTKGVNSINSLKTSLNHSARSEKRHTLEWIDELSSNNLYFTREKYLSHQDFIKHRDQYLSFFDELESNSKCINDIKHKKELNRLSKLRSSYYHKIQNLLPKDHQDKQTLLDKLAQLESKENKQKQISKNRQIKYVEALTRVLLPRYKELKYSKNKIDSKLRVLNNYLLYRRQHIDIKYETKNRKIKNKNSTQIVEAVLKLPHNHGDFSFIDAKEFLSAGVSFYQKYFPKNKIHLAALHDDESKHVSTLTGRNFHIFIGAHNGTNMTYRQQYLTFARDYAKEYYPEDFAEILDINPNEKQNSNIMVLCGQVMQLAFLSHIQRKLFNRYSIELVLLNDNQRKEFNNIQACLEQHLPIEDRQQSRYNMLIEHSEKLKQQNKIQNKMISTLEQQISNQQEKIEKLNKIHQSKLDELLDRINIWKISKLPTIDDHLINLIQSNPQIKKISMEEIEQFEINHTLTE
ncbi:hypothetical protein L1D40_20080, partial [Shewanella insulae]|uniref:hypothetical protein n=1 Tax=Shewanella insulae TaxID=2681496 RepID=UPI001EFD28D9